jgi:uncharacterized membrane protein (UPF0136 family)
MAKVAALLSAVTGVVSIVGGVMGYIQKDSMPSLIAGGVSGLLLLLSAALILRKPVWGLVAASVVAVALLGRFAPGVIKNAAESPPIFIVLVVCAMLLVLTSVFALVGKPGRSGGC